MKIVVFALHGCPSSWLGCYGNDWVGTPNLDRFAAEGIVFDRHFSNCPDPIAARNAWKGSDFGNAHTVLLRANHPDTDAPDWYYDGWSEVFDTRPQAEDTSPLDELLRNFPRILEQLAAFTNCLLWIEIDRLIPPWDVQLDVFKAYLTDEDDSIADHDLESYPDDQKDESVSELIEEEPHIDTVEANAEPVSEEPVVPFADPPTGPFNRSDIVAWDWLHRTFAAVVTKLDAELGVCFEELRSNGFDESSAWFITSDYGYPLGEHGQVGRYRPWLHEEMVHLPLLVRLPGAEQAGRRIAAFTQPQDLYPTILTLLGNEPSGIAKGFNLLPLMRGEQTSTREFAISSLELGESAEDAIRTEEWGLLVPRHVADGDTPRERMLFTRPDDRWEVNDLCARNIEQAELLEQMLKDALVQQSK